MLKRCQSCGKLFEANRKDQKYCCSNCRKFKSKSWGKLHISIDDYTTTNIYIHEDACHDVPSLDDIADVVNILSDFGVDNVETMPTFHSRIELTRWKNRVIDTVLMSE